MITKEIANILNGNEYGKEIIARDEQDAKENGVVIVFGASDDLMEFRGAIDDEIDCFGGGKAYLDKKGLFVNECHNADCPYFRGKLLFANVITAIWDSDGFSWVYRTDVPHESFEIFDGEIKYCRGLVFSMGDLK